MSADAFNQEWLGELDELCDRFESAWKAGSPQPIEGFVVDVAPDRQRHFTRELLQLEIEYRKRSGLTPTLADYLDRFPEMRSEIESLFLEPTVIAADRRSLVSSLPQPAERIGDFDIIERLKAGGMGVIYKARQVSVNRLVALKLIRSGDAADPKEIERFKTEGEALAKLEHPGIVPIFGSGVEDGQHYIAMAFIDGPSLAERIAQSPMPAREAAELVRRVAIAVDYIHRQGVIHRDLKPGNILLAPLDSVSGRGRGIWEDSAVSANSADAAGLTYEPKVTDFGLAKLTEHDRELTKSGEILGTLEYMPPEQASGRMSEVDQAADIYSLGAILYRLLAGRPPFQAANNLDLIRQLTQDDPVSLRVLSPSLNRDLETICLKCLEKNPARRFQTANDLAAELQRFHSGEPIRSRHVTRLERVWRWCRRHPISSALVFVSVSTFVVSVVASYQYFLRTESDLQSLLVDARGLRRILERHTDQRETLSLLRQERWHSGKVGRDPYLPPVSDGERLKALEVLSKAARIRPSPEVRGEAVACMAFSDAVQPAATDGRQWPSAPHLSSMFLSADRKTVFAGSRFGLVTWKTEKLIASADPNETVTPRADRSLIVATPDGRLVARQLGESVVIDDWDSQQSQLQSRVAEHRVNGKVRAMQFSSQDGTLTWADNEGVTVWDRKANQLQSASRDIANSLSFDHAGERLAIGLADGSVTVWSRTSSPVQLAPFREPASIRDLAWRPDDHELAVAADNNCIALIDPQGTGEPRVLVAGTGIWDATSAGLQAVAYSPDGRYLAAGGENRRIEVWDLATGHLVLNLDPDDQVNDLLWADTGDAGTIFYAGDMRFASWKIAFPNGCHVLKGSDYGEWLPTLGFSPRGDLLATVNKGIIVKIWDAQSGTLLRSFQSETAGRDLPWATKANAGMTVRPSLTFSRDGRSVAVGGPHEVRVWDVSTGIEQNSYKLERYAYQVLHFREDGRLIALQTEPTPEWHDKHRRGETSPPDSLVAVIRDVETGEYISDPPALADSERRQPYYLLAVYALADGSRVDLSGSIGKSNAISADQKQRYDTTYTLPEGKKLEFPGHASSKTQFYPVAQDWWFVVRTTPSESHHRELWRETRGELRRVLNIPPTKWMKENVTPFAALDPDGQLVALPDEKALMVWDLRSARELLRIPWITGGIPDLDTMRFSPHGSKLAVSTRDGAVVLFDFVQLRTALAKHGLAW